MAKKVLDKFCKVVYEVKYFDRTSIKKSRSAILPLVQEDAQRLALALAGLDALCSLRKGVAVQGERGFTNSSPQRQNFPSVCRKEVSHFGHKCKRRPLPHIRHTTREKSRSIQCPQS